ncbi:HD-GYP domain-containing protein [Clostridium gasigenes]|uniref:HD domain-containing protein n=1 Tax=Clostridium gasigenes TaxID=94869 RepID=A0A7X0SCX0_9CLOT|nr:HD domain-containing phosphohydrolase [Clostridium gasigenes]MBB6715340.1 HD domain-containing protein [Clostridium gasigenes]MBU3133582.1 HD domain-containing protein [Clostridium gasigenes]
MRLVPVKYLKNDSILAKSIYNSDGEVLFLKHLVLNDTTIENLRKLGILSVYIIDKYCETTKDITDDILGEYLRIESIRSLKRITLAFTSLDVNKRYTTVEMGSLSEIIKIANSIVDKILKTSNSVISTTDIRAHENYHYAHALNVAIISTLLGKQLNYSKDRLVKLCLAALMHDMGKAFLENEILHQYEPSTKYDCEQLKSHPTLAYNYLKNNYMLDQEILLGILHHHESVDGSGYPNKIKSIQINEFAKIISIVNFYDGLLHNVTDVVLTSDSIESIMTYVDKTFDYNVTVNFFNIIEPFKKNTLVKLNNGDIARVEETLKGLPLRPKVKVLKSKINSNVGHNIDLSKALTLSIDKVVYYV